MIRYPKSHLRIKKAGLLVFVMLMAFRLAGQPVVFQVLEEGSSRGVGYVNIGIVGKNTGTVTDDSGRFILGFAELEADDSLRFSMIGYESKIVTAGTFLEDPSGKVFLKPRIYELPELRIVSPRGREIILGTPVLSNALRSGFSDNTLGSELGIKINVKKKIRVRDISLNVGICTYDSVTYRLNVYRLNEQEEWENKLIKPVYLSFSGKNIKEPVTLDLSQHYIYLEGQTIISLELFKDLGEGKLLFLTQFFTGTTYHRKSKEAIWTQSPGQIGIYLKGQAVR